MAFFDWLDLKHTIITTNFSLKPQFSWNQDQNEKLHTYIKSLDERSC